MRKIAYAVVAGAAALTTACKDTTRGTSVDAPTAEALSGALTKGGFQTIAVGMIATDRSLYSGTGATYTVLSGIFARDLVRYDASEPRYVSETLGGNPDPGSFAGGGGFGGAYTAIRAANTLIAALKNP